MRHITGTLAFPDGTVLTEGALQFRLISSTAFQTLGDTSGELALDTEGVYDGDIEDGAYEVWFVTSSSQIKIGTCLIAGGADIDVVGLCEETGELETGIP